MDIVNSARQAGVPEKQIREMLELAMKGRSKLPDFPAADESLARISFPKQRTRRKMQESLGCQAEIL